MNIYDFDGTIYQGNSTFDFYIHCVKRHPKLLFTIPKQLCSLTLRIFGKYDEVTFVEHFYSFLNQLENISSDLEDFWKQKEHKIQKFYQKKKTSSDIVISASPDFLLRPICQKLGVKKLVASEFDPHTGKCTGIYCQGEKRLPALKNAIKGDIIQKFYSDSIKDEPIAKVAQCAYLVKKGRLIPWNEYEPSVMDKIKNMFFETSFILFLIVGCINTINGILFSFLYSLFISNANVAFVVGYITSLTISYLLNSYISFKEKLTWKKYIKFCISYVPNFIIQNIIVFLVYNLLGCYKLIAYALAAIIGLPVTYILIKVFAFRRKVTK